MTPSRHNPLQTSPYTARLVRRPIQTPLYGRRPPTDTTPYRHPPTRRGWSDDPLQTQPPTDTRPGWSDNPLQTQPPTDIPLHGQAGQTTPYRHNPLQTSLYRGPIQTPSHGRQPPTDPSHDGAGQTIPSRGTSPPYPFSLVATNRLIIFIRSFSYSVTIYCLLLFNSVIFLEQPI